MTVGIVGLGLIGGSFAKAYREQGHTVLACDLDEKILSFAILSGVVSGELTRENAETCDLILVAIYPQAAIDWLRDMAPYFGEKPLVMDCCGVKRIVCEAVFPLAKRYGFTFVGGHPMAGRQYAGFKYAAADLFRRAPMVVVPPDGDDIVLLDRVKELLTPVGFGRYTVTTARRHDRMIAFTSQLSHAVASAYVKSPGAEVQKDFSGGSYRDMTRVANLNPRMWAELFVDNRDLLLEEMNTFLANLTAYKDALERCDKEELTRLLEEGRRRKEEVDGK